MSNMTYSDWQSRAETLEIEGRAFIDGQYVNALSGQVSESINPSNGRKLAEVALCGPEDADQAVKVARRAFESGVWSKMVPMERKKILIRWADLIEQNLEELALLESLDAGKPISDTLNSDIPSAANTIRWTGEAIDKAYEQIAPTGHDSLALVTRLPLGVVVAIVPWNYPMTTTAWKLAPALATGNSVVLKPDPKTPLTALRIAQLASEAGLPDGVLNVLPGDGATLGRHLCLHQDVDGQTFTGSTAVGKLLTQYSGQSNLKRTFLELGGKSANIIFADANLEKAASLAAIAGFYNCGQTCTAGTRLLIEQSVYDEFLAMVVEKSKGWIPENALDPATRMGPVIDKNQFETISKYVSLGLEEGAQLASGGAQVLAESGGYYHQATIFSGANNQMRIAREEIFGPVISAIPFSDATEAVSIANDSPYGLAGAVWSRNINTAHKVAAAVRTGTMGINNYFGGDITVPFGGFKESGNGRDKSMHAFDDYTELKTTWIEFE